MASKKDKYLESAQKFIAKGQFDRAIKDYEQAVALDPKDIRARQRLAELLVRVNRKVEAIGEYDAIGRYYADNTYYLKAIAVYKQVQKLDPGNVTITLTLASLNEKQGLAGNALAEYDQVYTHHQKAGQYAEALKVIDRMLAVDPENLNSHLKLAETEFSAGNVDKSYADFVKLLMVLEKRGDTTVFNQIADRVRALFPSRQDFFLDVMTALVDKGNGTVAAGRLQQYLVHNRGNARGWHLLADAYRTAGILDKSVDTYRQMQELFPQDLSVNEGLIRLLLELDDPEQALTLLQEGREKFVAAGQLRTVEELYSVLLSKKPTDIRILEGLRDICAAAGDAQKHQQIVAQLAALGLRGAREPIQETISPAPATEEEVSVAEDLSPFVDGEIVPLEEEPSHAEQLPVEQPVAEEAPVSPKLPEEWEEELDLSFLDETESDVADLDYGTDELALAEEAGDDYEEPEVRTEEPLSLDIDVDELLSIDLAEATPFVPQPEASAVPGTSPAFTSAIRIDEQLDEGDAETHYSLGMAYKEMGLYDEAVAELRKASISPQRRSACLLLEGICYREKGDFPLAEKVLNEGRSIVGASTEEVASFVYELAYLCETQGRREDALRYYREITSIEPGFRDVRQRMVDLQGGDVGLENYDLDLEELEVDDSE